MCVSCRYFLAPLLNSPSQSNRIRTCRTPYATKCASTAHESRRLKRRSPGTPLTALTRRAFPHYPLAVTYAYLVASIYSLAASGSLLPEPFPCTLPHPRPTSTRPLHKAVLPAPSSTNYLNACCARLLEGPSLSLSNSHAVAYISAAPAPSQPRWDYGAAAQATQSYQPPPNPTPSYPSPGVHHSPHQPYYPQPPATYPPPPQFYPQPYPQAYPQAAPPPQPYGYEAYPAQSYPGVPPGPVYVVPAPGTFHSLASDAQTPHTRSLFLSLSLMLSSHALSVPNLHWLAGYL